SCREFETWPCSLAGCGPKRTLHADFLSRASGTHNPYATTQTTGTLASTGRRLVDAEVGETHVAFPRPSAARRVAARAFAEGAISGRPGEKNAPAATLLPPMLPRVNFLGFTGLAPVA